jgi:hypothetical protein
MKWVELAQRPYPEDPQQTQQLGASSLGTETDRETPTSKEGSHNHHLSIGL